MPKSKRKDRLEKLKRIATDAAAAPNEKEIAQGEIRRMEQDKSSGPIEPLHDKPPNLPLWEYGLGAGQPEPKRVKSAGLPGWMPGPKKPRALTTKQ